MCLVCDGVIVLVYSDKKLQTSNQKKTLAESQISGACVCVYVCALFQIDIEAFDLHTLPPSK